MVKVAFSDDVVVYKQYTLQLMIQKVYSECSHLVKESDFNLIKSKFETVVVYEEMNSFLSIPRM